MTAHPEVDVEGSGAVPISWTAEDLALDEIQPYWRNPRDVDEADVEKVAASITEYGYQNPIIVDLAHVIITGHTRYRALRRLGYTHCVVLVTDLPEAKAREYRLIDNRTSEYARWRQDDLILELREFSAPALDLHFPHIDLSTGFSSGIDPVTQGTLDATAARLAGTGRRPESETREITCPHCHTPFTLSL